MRLHAALTAALLALVCSAPTTEAATWLPKRGVLGVGLGVHAKDFVNSRNLPSVSPGSGPLGTTSSSKDLVERGGHSTLRVPPPANLNEEVEYEPEKSKSVVEETSAGAATALAKAVTNSTAVTSTSNEIENIQHIDVTINKKALKKSFKTSYAKKLKSRNSMNLRRKVLHAGFGLFFGILNHVVPRKYFLGAMTILSTGTLCMELLRYRPGFSWMNDALHTILGGSLRRHEMDGKFTGSLYFFVGVTVTSALFSKAAATLGIFQLAIADPSASYFGRSTRHVYWSRIESGLGGFGRNKGFLGFLGGALACVPLNYQVLRMAQFGKIVPGGQQALLTASLALGMAGAFADLAVPTPALVMPEKVFGVRVPPFHVDDNFVVPIFAGFAATHIFKALSCPTDFTLAPFVFI
uniref:Phosphatidate cytidylyltransferase n=1 Tax=Grammatophora oceanica TaxID=210454 RepID=A0A6U5JUM7_9STRA|mmetsp:Transcript_26715/g.39044  ORF Transcript_26715/g.39044 Transcript_26715/m.39044 type:complete len:409 (+) Transcript_26715:128-1354(+)|eukprot:CAMPEP_0194028386 /NCGR_PEP_ID=MMETSP0009_2-20130614/2367_1 /TAXON_ID=210454 /ORGANISM="Grammatophora oceanica, Strain CCMP 410" /LENGTH=408 /DNA_ID=CAMNT_0038667765 /DNA_START=70 /DNA_END=1296 /DNA_ORIENTATION=-